MRAGTRLDNYSHFFINLLLRLYEAGTFFIQSRPGGMSLVQDQFVIFKPLSYCFEETMRFDVKASFASRPLSRLIR